MSEVTNTNELMEDAKCIDSCVPVGLQLPALIVLFAQMAGLAEAGTPIPDSPQTDSDLTLSLNRITTDTAFFSWIYSEANPADGFAIYYGTEEGGGMSPLVYASGSQRSVVAEGLDPGTTYYFVVVTMGANNIPQRVSQPIHAVSGVAQASDEQITLAVTGQTSTTMDLTWALPGAGTSPLGGFTIVGRPSTSPDYTIVIEGLAGSLRSYTVPALTASTQYFFRILAPGNEYLPSDEASGTTSSASTPGHSNWAVDMTAKYMLTPHAGVVVDSAGRAITAGGYNRGDTASNPDFGGGDITGTTGIRNGYVAIYNADHTLRWVRLLQSQGSAECILYGLTVDNQDRIIVCGLFTGTVDFGGESMTSVGITDGFVVKYLPGSQGTAGAIVWKRQFTSGGNINVPTVAVDSNRDVFVAATMNASQSNFGTTNTPVYLAPDFCIVKLNGTTGVTNAGATRAFANSNYPQASDFPRSLAVDGANNVIMTGKVGGPTSFGGSSGTGIFVVKFSGTDLSHIWSAFPGAGQGNDIAVRASNNNIYVGGNDSLGFFIAAYNTSGTLLWNYQNGGPAGSGNAGDSVIAISVTNSKIAITGRSDYALYFGHGTVFGTGYFMVQFTPSGDAMPTLDDFVKRATSNGQSWGFGIAHSGSVLYNVGPFQSYAMNFGDGVTVAPRSFQDAFLLQCNS